MGRAVWNAELIIKSCLYDTQECKVLVSGCQIQRRLFSFFIYICFFAEKNPQVSSTDLDF